MSKTRQALDELIANAVAALGYEFWGCELLSQPGGKLVRVYIEQAQGIHIDDCEKASRQISAMMDVEEPITGHYILEVSSPGLNRPLFTLAQCQRFIGHKLQVRLRQLSGNRRNFAGVLLAVNDEEIKLQLDGDNEINLVFAEIDKANLVFSL